MAGESVRNRFATDAHRAPIGLYEPAGNPEEGRLTRAVLTDQGMDLTVPTVEADVGERPDRPELAGHARQLEDQVSDVDPPPGAPSVIRRNIRLSTCQAPATFRTRPRWDGPGCSPPRSPAASRGERRSLPEPRPR